METRSNHFEVIQDIVSNEKLITDEQIKQLSEYKKSVEIAIESAIRTLKMELRYCSECGEYYRKQSFEETIYKKYPKDRSLYSCKEVLDAATEEYPCYICPKGHKIIERLRQEYSACSCKVC